MRKILILSLLLVFMVPNISLAENNTPPPACDDNLPIPSLEANVRDNDIVLSWNKIDHYNLDGYKIVVSKNDSSPAYPNNGYLTWITNRNTVSYEVDNSDTYKNGDFGSYLESGENYYFSVTAVYGCGEKVTGNVLQKTYPGSNNNTTEEVDTNNGYDDGNNTTDNVAFPAPVVEAQSSDAGIKLSWNKINDNRFTGYKIVIAKDTKNPKYPNHGYARYITNPDTTSFLLDNSSAYIRGDFGGYLKPGENYFLSITALYGDTRIAGNAVEAIYNGPSNVVKPDVKKDPIVVYAEKAKLLNTDNGLGAILDELQELRDLVREQQSELKYMKTLLADFKNVAQGVQDALNNFITYGVDENTQKLGAGERAAVINSFKAAFNKLPETDDEMADAIKIANGRWPSQTNKEAEDKAKSQFKKIYLRDADMNNPNDNAAVTVMAYGLRQKAENRNLKSEEQGINTFKYIYNKLPETTEEWNIMQAITYSGASR